MKKLLILFCFLSSFWMFSQEKKTAEKLVNEIQQMKQTANNFKLIWWIPTEYWRIAIQDNNLPASQEQIDYFESLLNDYTIIVAGDYSLASENGNITFKVNDFKNNFHLSGLQGEKLNVLKDSEINDRVLMIIDNTLKPLFAQMLGKTGDGVEFFIYNNVKNGKRIIDPTKPGVFKVELSNETFQWKLPLVSLMKEKKCPVDQEKMEGNWMYCPIHGEKL